MPFAAAKYAVPELVKAPLLTMVKDPLLSSVVVNAPFTLIPLPAAPETLIVMSPPVCVKSPSALNPEV